MKIPNSRILIIPAAIAFGVVMALVATAFSNKQSTESTANANSTVSNTPEITQSMTPLPLNTPTTAPTATPKVPSNESGPLDKYIFYPVDKQTALDKNFVPKNLVTLSDYGISVSSASFQMRKEAITDLKALFDDAKANGIYLRVTSPYRSYDNQVTTFNYWKSLELAKGLSDEQATIEANKSSAFPGHSEHQLGVVCDVISGSDTTLDFTDSNKKAWKWMDAHLIEHGFVLSYPEGKDDKTGYVYEPWHIRWVGKDIAKEIEKTDYTNPANSNTSTKYLNTVWKSLN